MPRSPTGRVPKTSQDQHAEAILVALIDELWLREAPHPKVMPWAVKLQRRRVERLIADQTEMVGSRLQQAGLGAAFAPREIKGEPGGTARAQSGEGLDTITKIAIFFVIVVIFMSIDTNSGGKGNPPEQDGGDGEGGEEGEEGDEGDEKGGEGKGDGGED